MRSVRTGSKIGERGSRKKQKKEANNITTFIGTTPQYAPLFEDIARYTTSLLARNDANRTPQHHHNNHTNNTVPIEANDDGPAAKKRKLQQQNGDAPGKANANANAQDLKTESSLQFSMPDVSFAIPQRKKLTLEVTAGNGYLRARNQTSKEVEFGVSMDKIREFFAWFLFLF